MKNHLQELYGNIDIYLFDQLLKGTYGDCRSVIDIGCGSGRNIVYFLKNGYDVFGADPNVDAIEAVRGLSLKLAPSNPLENFVVATAEDMPFGDAAFDWQFAARCSTSLKTMLILMPC